jgi:hypothetical protein
MNHRPKDQGGRLLQDGGWFFQGLVAKDKDLQQQVYV